MTSPFSYARDVPALLTALARVTSLLAAGLIAACAPSEPGTADRSATITPLPSPAGVRSGEPHLTTGADGAVHLSWLEKTGDSTVALRLATLTGEAWSPPVTIVERSDLFVNWADFPAVIAPAPGRLVAHWLQRRAGGKYSYDIMVALSDDGGRTWSDGQVLHRDGLAAEHGFLAFWPGDGGAVEAAWLDGRGTASSDTSRRAMHVATTSIAPDGSLGTERLLDTRTCDCCQVAATVTSHGPVVAYRDRSPDEVRDIAIVRRVDGAWTEPRLVHDDGWQIAACPVNGPALSARGDTVVIAWFTGAQDTARVRVAYSVDAGATFAPPQRVDGGNPAGRVDVELLADGSAAVSWLERTDSTEAEVRVRRVRANGALGAPSMVARSKGARASGFPRLTRVADTLYAAWTVPGDSARVQLAKLQAKALP